MKTVASGFALILVSTGLAASSQAQRPAYPAGPLPFDWVALSEDLVISGPDGSEPLPAPKAEVGTELQFPSIHQADQKPATTMASPFGACARGTTRTVRSWEAFTLSPWPPITHQRITSL